MAEAVKPEDAARAEEEVDPTLKPLVVNEHVVRVAPQAKALNAAAAADDDDEDDDDEEDSDYDPTKDADADDDDGGGGAAATGDRGLGGGMGTYRKRKVDALWDEMNGQDDAYLRVVMGKAVGAKAKGKGKSKKLGKKKKRALKVLGGIFGKAGAAAIVGKADAGRRKRKRATEDVSEAARAAVRNVKSEKVQITQSVKFAGEMTTVTKTVDAHSAEAKAASAPKKAKTGLESVLDEMKGPKTISTLEKTSVDWDGYKEEHKLNDSLADASKDGYLTRQDFLQRVDARTFENEKAARAVDRAKAAAAAQK
eukprot:CAMPEP_0118857720 /NCGR_PEP_ID=MMETSP1163-20130328/4671_1 /TAXON_ID=124430 /ORGANISM="Phaeomonas parva, Strain CCMP2877" /LENGTH=309 /DNA_ID=CAMNT_0006791059 /DNA_START=232 /DNA_END=1161 /DNA_ORIENTATION=+